MSALQDRFNATLARADAVLGERLRREEQELARQDAEQRRADAAEARAHAERKRQIQARYADSFAAFGSEVPAPIDDESPGRYRMRLFDRLARKLPPSHELSGIYSDDIPAGAAAQNFERMLLDAARQEAERPSLDSLPRDGSLVSRVRTDADTNARRIEWSGRESFIKSFSRGGMRVAGFHPGAAVRAR